MFQYMFLQELFYFIFNTMTDFCRKTSIKNEILSVHHFKMSWQGEIELIVYDS